tara:strand:- start:14 stop:202 length:189 start_codon:yes stop_codon:yes gene_type:complete
MSVEELKLVKVVFGKMVNWLDWASICILFGYAKVTDETSIAIDAVLPTTDVIALSILLVAGV